MRKLKFWVFALAIWMVVGLTSWQTQAGHENGMGVYVVTNTSMCPKKAMILVAHSVSEGTETETFYSKGVCRIYDQPWTAKIKSIELGPLTTPDGLVFYVVRLGELAGIEWYTLAWPGVTSNIPLSGGLRAPRMPGTEI